MNRFNPLRYQVLCGTTSAVASIGFALDRVGLSALAAVWAIYLLAFVLVSVMREGVRGLRWPSVAFGAMALFHGAQLRDLLIATGLAAVAIAVAIAALKFTAIRISGLIARWRARRRTKERPLHPVTIAAAKNTTNVDAAEVLSRLGLSEG